MAESTGATADAVTVRRAVAGDAAAIAGFQLTMALETEKVALEADVIAKGVARILGDDAGQRGMYLVAEVAGEVVGSCLVTFEWSDWRASDYWWLQSVFVVQAHRRKGIFRRLHATAREMAVAAGSTSLRLYVEHDNVSAQATYVKLGMQKSHYVMMAEDLPKAEPSQAPAQAE